MVLRAIELVRERMVRGEGASAHPFGSAPPKALRGHPRLMWTGLAGAAAIVPALVLGIGHGTKPAGDGEPLTTGSISTPIAASGAAALQTPAVAAAPAQPIQVERVGALAMVRNVLIAVQQANETGNYTVLRDLGSPAFQAANTAARLSEIFSALRARNLDLSAAAALDPQMTVPPELNGDGMMHMAGLIPAIPAPISFDLAFAAVEGRWMPFSISIALAPAPPPPSAAAPPVEKRAEQAPQPSRSGQAISAKQRSMAQPLDTARPQ